MAARTFTASEVILSGPLGARNSRAGLNIVRGRIEVPIASSLSASDVLFMCRIPNNATLVDWYVRGGIAASTTWILSVGFSAASGGAYPTDQLTEASLSANSLASTVSLTTSAVGGWNRAQTAGSAMAIPAKLSIVTDNWVWLTATCGGSTTGSMSLDLVAYYMLGE